jgi:glutathionyl-hydroquinone reductase
MGQMIDGAWVRQQHLAATVDGAFQRPATTFHDVIGPHSAHRPGAGRYHLYVSLACPWAHRTLIVRALKGLEKLITVSAVHWFMGEDGWTFEPGEGVVPDPVMGASHLYQLYARAKRDFSGRVTVPVLWDLSSNGIVNNESSEIVRIFNYAFDELGARPGDFYPEALRGRIDPINERVYATLNNGVYRAGFASTQAAYEAAVVPLFETLDWLEGILAHQPFLAGDTFTEADIRLFTTLIRFEPVYHYHFKCNLRRLRDYPALWDFTRSLYQVPAIRGTVDFGHIKRHYFMSHGHVNPTRIVPLGPLLDLDEPGSRLPALLAQLG